MELQTKWYTMAMVLCMILLVVAIRQSIVDTYQIQARGILCMLQVDGYHNY
jgi:hypothetical protein